MSQIAIDIVLLPETEMTEKAIRMNQELSSDALPKIILHEETCLPHISLCMAYTQSEDIGKLWESIEAIVQKYQPFSLRADRMDLYNLPTGEVFSALHIEKTHELQSLFEDIIDASRSLISFSGTREAFYSSEEIDDISLSWVSGYESKYIDHTLFDPHISIGIGKPDEYQFPIYFSASTIAICQLGNYCTCRKILIETSLH